MNAVFLLFFIMSNEKVPLDPKTERHFFELYRWRNRLFNWIYNIEVLPEVIAENLFLYSLSTKQLKNLNKVFLISIETVLKP